MTKLFDRIKMIIGASAAVCYIKTDDQTQMIMDMITKGHDTLKAAREEDLSAKTVDGLMGDIRHFVLVEGGYMLLLAKFDIDSADLEFLSPTKRRIVETVVRAQHRLIKNHLINLLEELKGRFQ